MRKVGDGAGSRIVSPFEMARTRQVARERVDDADVSQCEWRHRDTITRDPEKAETTCSQRVARSGVECVVERHADAGALHGFDRATERVAAEQQPVPP